MMSKLIPILVIQTEEHIRSILQYDLKLDGFEVYLAQDGPTGLQLAQEKNPELILLDLEMAVIDGLEVLYELKHDKATSHIPVFILTSRITISDIERAFSMGADDYITKPFDPTRLGRILKAKLKKYANQAGVR